MIKYNGGDFRNYLDRVTGTLPRFDIITIGQYRFSIQASEFNYSTPRINSSNPFDYSAFEIGCCGQLFNVNNGNILTSDNADETIVEYLDYRIIQQMLDWYYTMLSKEQYLSYVVKLENDKPYDFVRNFISKNFNNCTLNNICDMFIYIHNETKYKRELKDYLNLKYSDLLDIENNTSKLDYTDILNKL